MPPRWWRGNTILFVEEYAIQLCPWACHHHKKEMVHSLPKGRILCECLWNYYSHINITLGTCITFAVRPIEIDFCRIEQV